MSLGFRKRCGWCGVELRRWQLDLCARCRRAAVRNGPDGGPPCREGSRWHAEPDVWGWRPSPSRVIHVSGMVATIVTGSLAWIAVAFLAVGMLGLHAVVVDESDPAWAAMPPAARAAVATLMGIVGSVFVLGALWLLEWIDPSMTWRPW